MTAAGFTFSTPKIKVKLSQEAEATPAASPKPFIQKRTISCVKGKASKNVTALKPKCPAGFKKK
jgi:hypothetical protein